MGGKKLSGTTTAAILAVVVVIVGILAYKFVFSNNQYKSPEAQAFEDKMRAAHTHTAGPGYPSAAPKGGATQ